MKVYNIAPMYLSSIQQGIQAAHAQVKLVKNYQNDSRVQNWVDSPTTICLNGSSSIRMHELKDFFRTLLNVTLDLIPRRFFRGDFNKLVHLSS